MRYRTRVTAPAAALIDTAAALAGAPPALAPQTPQTTGTSAAKTSGAPGPETLGDLVFPDIGNDGYRVSAYHLDFSYDATTRRVDATATLKIRTTQALTLPPAFGRGDSRLPRRPRPRHPRRAGRRPYGGVRAGGREAAHHARAEPPRQVLGHRPCGVLGGPAP